MTETSGESSTAKPSDGAGSDAWTGEWELDPRRSSLRFRSSSMWGLTKVNGQFTDIRGEGSVSPDGSVSGHLEISAASADTGNSKRDRHLRSDDFFHTSTHPHITYTITGIHTDGPGHIRVSGDLRVVDQTHPLELGATIDEVPPDGATITTEAEMDRSVWGIDFKKMGMTKMATRIEGRLTFTRR